MRNPLNLIQSIFTKPATVPAQTIRDFPQLKQQLRADPKSVTQKDIDFLKRLGLRGGQMRESLTEALEIIWERTQNQAEAEMTQSACSPWGRSHRLGHSSGVPALHGTSP
jgi:hypothetical protein